MSKAVAGCSAEVVTSESSSHCTSSTVAEKHTSRKVKQAKASPTVTAMLCQTSESASAGSKQFDLTKFIFKEKQVAEKAAAHKAQQKATAEMWKKEYIPDKSDSRVTHIHRLLDDPYTKLNCLFLQAAILMFDAVNTVLQNDEPCIHILHSVLLDLLQSVLVRFVKPRNITVASKLTKVHYSQEDDQKADEDLTIGAAATDFIRTHSTVLASRLRQFYKSVRKYYLTACNYMISKFPFHDPVLLNAEVANVATRDQQSFQKVSTLLNVTLVCCHSQPHMTVLKSSSTTTKL